MILGTGIDIVEIKRFYSWVTAEQPRLAKIFTPCEVDLYMHEMMQNDTKQTAENRAAYCAVRFAAKEAFYKALSVTLINLGYSQHPFSLMVAIPHVEILKKRWQVPYLKINWQAIEIKIGQDLPKIQTNVSLSHDAGSAVAHVILSRYISDRL